MEHVQQRTVLRFRLWLHMASCRTQNVLDSSLSGDASFIFQSMIQTLTAQLAMLGIKYKPLDSDV